MSTAYHFIIKEIDLVDDCRHKRYFRLSLTGTRAITSLNYFFWGTKRRNYKPSYVKGTHLYYCQREHEFNEDQERHKKQNLHWKGELIEVDSIWAFYKAIGYDYKKQKWV